MTHPVAATILEQLGGRRFIAMTGATNLLGRADGLSFKIGRNERGITHCRITLTAKDDYILEFFKIRGSKSTPAGLAQGVYNDNLCAVFEDKTGLRTSL